MAPKVFLRFKAKSIQSYQIIIIIITTSTDIEASLKVHTCVLVLFNAKANLFTNGRVHNPTVEEQANKNFDSQYLQN